MRGLFVTNIPMQATSRPMTNSNWGFTQVRPLLLSRS